MTRRYALLSALLVAGACGGGADDDSAAPPAAPAPADSAAVAAGPVDTREPWQLRDSMEALDAQLTRERQATMSKYDECMRQTRDVPEPARRKIEEACSNLSDAPK